MMRSLQYTTSILRVFRSISSTFLSQGNRMQGLILILLSGLKYFLSKRMTPSLVAGLSSKMTNGLLSSLMSVIFKLKLRPYITFFSFSGVLT